MEIGIQSECFYGRTDDKWKPKNASSFIGRRTIVFKGWTFEQEFTNKRGKIVQNKNSEEFSI